MNEYNNSIGKFELTSNSELVSLSATLQLLMLLLVPVLYCCHYSVIILSM